MGFRAGIFPDDGKGGKDVCVCKLGCDYLESFVGLLSFFVKLQGVLRYHLAFFCGFRGLFLSHTSFRSCMRAATSPILNPSYIYFYSLVIWLCYFVLRAAVV